MEEMLTIFNHRVGLGYIIRLESVDVARISVMAAKTGDSFDSTPLYANYIWPGSIVMADFIQENPCLVKNKQILELGAGTGLPSLVSCKLHSSVVVCTDFPEPTVIENLSHLRKLNNCENMMVQSLEWGCDEHLERLRNSTFEGKGFDVVLLAELLWKDTYKLHNVLAKSVRMLCADNGVVLIAFAHRPSEDHLPENDMEFIARLESELSLKACLVSKSSVYKDAIELEYPEVLLYKLSI